MRNFFKLVEIAKNVEKFSYFGYKTKNGIPFSMFVLTMTRINSIISNDILSE